MKFKFGDKVRLDNPFYPKDTNGQVLDVQTYDLANTEYLVRIYMDSRYDNVVNVWLPQSCLQPWNDDVSQHKGA